MIASAVRTVSHPKGNGNSGNEEQLFFFPSSGMSLFSRRGSETSSPRTSLAFNMPIRALHGAAGSMPTTVAKVSDAYLHSTESVLVGGGFNRRNKFRRGPISKVYKAREM